MQISPSSKPPPPPQNLRHSLRILQRKLLYLFARQNFSLFQESLGIMSAALFSLSKLFSIPAQTFNFFQASTPPSMFDPIRLSLSVPLCLLSSSRSQTRKFYGGDQKFHNSSQRSSWPLLSPQTEDVTVNQAGQKPTSFFVSAPARDQRRDFLFPCNSHARCTHT